MRVFLISMAVLCVAACSPRQPPGTTAQLAVPPGAAEAPPRSASPPLAQQPLPPPAPAPVPPATAYVPPAPPPAMAEAAPPPQAAAGPSAGFFHHAPPRLLLSNFSVAQARVETVVTRDPSCDARGAGVVAAADFLLPLNGTRIIAAPPGADVCWRRELAAAAGGTAPPLWSPWNRAYLSAGHSVDTGL